MAPIRMQLGDNAVGPEGIRRPQRVGQSGEGPPYPAFRGSATGYSHQLGLLDSIPCAILAACWPLAGSCRLNACHRPCTARPPSGAARASRQAFRQSGCLWRVARRAPRGQMAALIPSGDMPGPGPWWPGRYSGYRVSEQGFEMEQWTGAAQRHRKETPHDQTRND